MNIADHHDRVPFVREIMECLSPDHPAQRVVYLKSAQMAGTECGLNWVGSFIATQRGPMLCVQPTLEMAERWSKHRLAPMIEATPTLRTLIAPARARDSGNTVLMKEFPGGILMIAGANSPNCLPYMPAKYVFLDEVDTFDCEGMTEVETLQWFENRQRTYSRRKTLLVSTPTVAGLSRIWREYLASDQRLFHVPCPECGAEQPLEFEQLDWPSGHPEEARYGCIACCALIEEHHKTDMLAAGRWIAREPGRHVPGFAINGLYTPVGLGRTWAEIARAYDDLNNDNEKHRWFENLVLGRVTPDLVRFEWDDLNPPVRPLPTRRHPGAPIAAPLSSGQFMVQLCALLSGQAGISEDQVLLAADASLPAGMRARNRARVLGVTERDACRLRALQRQAARYRRRGARSRAPLRTGEFMLRMRKLLCERTGISEDQVLLAADACLPAIMPSRERARVLGVTDKHSRFLMSLRSMGVLKKGETYTATMCREYERRVRELRSFGVRVPIGVLYGLREEAAHEAAA